MSSLRKYLLYLIAFLSTGVILLSLFSLIHNLQYWYFKILDFPRLQYLILAALLFLFFVIINKKWRFSAILLGLGLITSIFIQGQRIYPYYFGKKTVPDALVENNQTKVGILLANVLIKNRKSEEFIELVQNADPDIVLAMEVNRWWIDQLQILKNSYSYSIEHPLDNAYGMALFSKIPIENREIMFLSKDDVPSFRVEFSTNSGMNFLFYGVHPVAPVPSQKYPDNKGEKEVSLIKVGEMVKQSNLPVIVAGDFNDVSWSHTSRLFQNEGKLENVRIGRGIYSSFDATSPVMRWPLDHFFVTKEFSVVSLERLQKFGSDHFPMYAEFTLPE